MKRTKDMWKRILCFLLCMIMVVMQVPDTNQAAVKKVKFIKSEPQAFIPSLGEKATVTWNLQNKHVVNVMVKHGDEVVAYLAKEKEYKGGYTPHELTWNGKDSSGNYVESGTYRVVVEPQDKYRKYRSVTEVSVITDAEKAIGILPNLYGDTFLVYGKGGKKQGTTRVALTAEAGGKQQKFTAEIGNSVWYAKIPMANYKQYDISASIKGSASFVKKISAVRHTMRAVDRLEYLGGVYYGDYLKDAKIVKDNHLESGLPNRGNLIGTSLIMVNPSGNIAQEIKDNEVTTNQHLGLIDRLEQLSGTNPVSLTMGNEFYYNQDIYLDGYVPLSFTRMYNSMSGSFHEFGLNWTDTYSYLLQDMGNMISVKFEDGHVEYYTKKEDGSYQPPDGLSRKLIKRPNGTYELTVEETRTITFTVSGRIRAVRDLGGMELKFQYYDGMLQKIINNSGFLSFAYYSNGALKSIATSGGERVSYEYTDGLLTGFTNMASNKTTYTYDKKNRLSKVISPEQVPLLELIYDDSNRVTEKKVSGSSYKYVYDDKNRTIQCTEPNGNQTLFRYTKDYRLESEESSDGIISYQYPEKSKTSEDSDKKAGGKEEIITASEKQMETMQIKPVGADQVLPATGPSITASPTPPEDNSGQILKLETYNISTVSGDGKNNTIYPQYKIQNIGKESISISDLTIRYYYTIDGSASQKFWCDWAGVQNGDIMNHITDKVSGSFAALSSPFAGADSYVETSFRDGAGEIDAGESLEIHTRFAKEGWQDYLPGDDYSQNMSGSFSEFDQVDVFYKGKLVWGKPHSGGTLPTPAPTETPKPAPSVTPSVMPSPDGQPSTPASTVPPKKNQLKLSMYNAGNGESSTNSIHPMMMLSNSGSNMVPLEQVKIRYYYTRDNDKVQNFVCDWSNAGTETVTGTFYTMETPKNGADTYLEIGFTKEAGYIGIGADIFIHSRIHKEDFSRYDLTGDFSLQPEERYMEWEKVDVFVGTEKVWGIGVLPAEGEEESGRIDYANMAYQPIRAEMFNYHKKESANSIAPRFRVYNTGTKDFRLSDLRINYFYTTDDEQEQIFEADHIGVSGDFDTFISSKDVTSEFSEVGEGNLETYCIADIGFTREDVIVAPGEYVELNVRIHRPDWSNYVQSNDYSFSEENDTYQEWDKISIFLDDVWVYGSMPMSYAGLIDPDPEKEKAKAESKISPTVITDKAGNSSSYSYDEKGNITSFTDAQGNVTKQTYNEWNQVTSVTDALGNVTEYDYDNKGNVTKVTDALGNETGYAYSGEGYLTKVVRPDGSTVKGTYDGKGNLTSLTDGTGAVTKYGYDTSNRMVSHMDANGNVTKFAYTPDGKISKTTDALGNTTSMKYNKDGKIAKEIDEKGNTTSYQYSKKTGLPIQMTDPLGGIISYTYNESRQLKSRTDEVGAKTAYVYDNFQRLSKETDELGNSSSYEYDRNGNLIKETDALGYTVSYTYDKCNRLIKESDASGVLAHNEYNANGDIMKRTDANGDTAEYTYDANRNLLKISDPLGHFVTFEYNKIGLCSKENDKLGNSTSYEYDKEGRWTKQIDAEGGITLWEYDPSGNLKKVTDANETTISYRYDKRNQLISYSDAAGNKTSYEYDEIGNLVKVTDPIGSVTQYSYDKLGNRIKITDALGGVSSFKYDKRSALKKTNDALGNQSVFTYDKAGNVITEVLVGNTAGKSQTTTYTYDKNGNITAIMDPEGRSIKYTYHTNSQLVGETGKDGSTIAYEYDRMERLAKVTYNEKQSIRYEYDKIGRLKLVDDWNGSIHYQYDAKGQVTKVTDANNREVEYTWTKTGQKKSMTAPNGDTISYVYDKVGNVLKATEHEGGITSYQYDTTGRLQEKQLPNGIRTEYTYNGVGQVIGLLEKENANVREQIYYTYDKNGNRLKETKIASGKTKQTVYAYDAVGQLVQASDGDGTRTYAYDEFYNRIKKTENGSATSYLHNAFNQLIEENGSNGRKQYKYDAVGNLIEMKENGRSKETYVFDGRNLLTGVERDGKRTEYRYDGQGSRIHTTVSELGSVTKDVEYVMDPMSANHNIIMASDRLSGEETIFRYGDGLISLSNSADTHYYKIDEKKSVTGLFDNSGNLEAGISYDEYGNVKNPEEVRQYGNIFAYTGYVYEDSTNLYYAKARYYDSESGRMISEDPIRAGRNWYIYANNNPVTFIDPWGLDAYVYYLPEWRNEATDDRKRLMKIHKLKKDQVHLIEIKNPTKGSTAIDEFAASWNSMGRNKKGDKVKIDSVIINTHANPDRLTNNKEWSLNINDIATLNNKDIELLILYGCNAGHLDYKEFNMASAFAKKVNKAPVLAGDGTVYSGKQYLNIFGPMTYTAKTSNKFKEFRDQVNPDSNRKAVGWIIYKQTSKGLSATAGRGKRMTLTQLIDQLTPKPKPQPGPPPTFSNY